MLKAKKLLSTILVTSMLAIMGTTVFASSPEQIGTTVTPQTLVEENVYGEDGSLTHEYIWRDSPSVTISTRLSESEQLDSATWIKHNEAAGQLKHRAAKISPPKKTEWYACSQTDYKAWHYSRSRIIKTLGGKILEDSDQVQVKSGIATARTPADKLYLNDYDFHMKSYWGV